MKKIILITLLLIGTATTSEAKKLYRGVQYAKMYEEKPQSIVIMPPINRSTHVEAKEYFYSTLHAPLCDKGYYVYSPMMTMDMFQTESAYDAEEFIEGNLTQFHELLGADAAMFTIIHNWARNKVLGSTAVIAEFILRSTKTGETLWTHKAVFSLAPNYGGNNLFGLLIQFLVKTTKGALTDMINVGRLCSRFAIEDLPLGPFSTNYEKDMEQKAMKYKITGSQSF